MASFSWSIQIFVADMENKNIKIYHCAFLPNVCLICNRELWKKTFKKCHWNDGGTSLKYQKHGLIQNRSIMSTAGLWTNEQCQKTFKKVALGHNFLQNGIHLQKGMNDNSNNWIRFQPWVLIRWLKVINMVVTVVASIFASCGELSCCIVSDNFFQGFQTE